MLWPPPSRWSACSNNIHSAHREKARENTKRIRRNEMRMVFLLRMVVWMDGPQQKQLCRSSKIRSGPHLMDDNSTPHTTHRRTNYCTSCHVTSSQSLHEETKTEAWDRPEAKYWIGSIGWRRFREWLFRKFVGDYPKCTQDDQTDQ